MPLWLSLFSTSQDQNECEAASRNFKIYLFDGFDVKLAANVIRASSGWQLQGCDFYIGILGAPEISFQHLPLHYVTEVFYLFWRYLF
jgi:hypothetical protein